MNATTPHLSNIKETAKALSVSVRTVNAMVGRGEIPSVKLGGRRLFNVARIIAHLEQRAESETAFPG